MDAQRHELKCDPEPCDSGKNASYYDIDVSSLSGKDVGMSYSVSCIDVICGLQMTFAEGEAFKAIWRKAAARMGNAKVDHNPLYDAEKVVYYGTVMEKLERGRK